MKAEPRAGKESNLSSFLSSISHFMILENVSDGLQAPLVPVENPAAAAADQRKEGSGATDVITIIIIIIITIVIIQVQ